MKKVLYILVSLAALLTLASCEKDKYGTVPGNDSEPYVLLSAIAPGAGYDPDCDILIRLAANNITTDVYYFAELKSQKDARNLAEDAYADYVVANGTKATLTTSSFDGSSNADVVMQSLFGENVISAVAISGDKKYIASKTYTGQKWNNVVTGNFTFKNSSVSSLAGGPKSVVLQQLDTDHDTYRFKDLYAEGYHLVFTIYRQNGNLVRATDPDFGEYTLCRVAAQDTGLNYGSYGAMSVRDTGYRYGDDSFDVELYDDNMVYLYVNYYVSAGNITNCWDNFKPVK